MARLFRGGIPRGLFAAKGSQNRPYDNTIVGNKIHTGEVKMANWMGDDKSRLREDIEVMGSLGGADVLISDKVPFSTETVNGVTAKVYPILFGSTEAVSLLQKGHRIGLMTTDSKTSLTMFPVMCYTPFDMTEKGQNEIAPMTASDIVCGLIAIAVVAVLFLVVIWFAAPYLAPYQSHLP